MTEYGGGSDTHRPEIPSSAGWATFEARVRGRRFARCIERAHAAIDSGDLDSARAAVDEAQALMPDAPEINELENRIATRPTAIDIPILAEMPPMEADPGWPRVIGAMAVLLLLFGLFGFGLAQLYFTRPAQQLLSAGSLLDDELAAVKDKSLPAAEKRAEPPAAAAVPQSTPDSTPAPTGLSTPPVEPKPETSAPAEARRVVPAPDVRSRPESQARLGSTTSKTKPPASSPRPDPSTTARNAATTGPPAGAPPAAAPPAAGRTADRTSALPDPAPATVSSPPPASTPAAPAPPVVETASVPLKPLDTPVPASRETLSADSRAEESARIRYVLMRYESAYNRLDATAASSVWPGVDEAALDRAFKGLLSQRVSLGLCDITVIGDIGGASCVGKARWEPRVGGGVQTADRHWTFNLRKSGDSWKIEQIRVR